MKRAAVAGLLALSLFRAGPLAAQSDPLAPIGRWSAYTRGAAQLPPMGWNSWNAFALDISEAKLIGSARIIVSSGLAAKGYRYIDLDEGWWARRAADGRMVIRADKFPSARLPDGRTSFRPLTDKLHGMGLKAGIYSDIGRNSCGQIHSDDIPNKPSGTLLEREVGLYGHVDQDIALYFGEWGFDLIKVDGCGIRGLWPESPKVLSGEFRALTPLVDSGSLGRTDIAATRALYDHVRQALERNNPDNDFIFSLCLWGAADVRSWARQMAGISRTSEDIFPIWGRMLHNMDTSIRRPLYAHPGSWNDPDMLYIGTGDFDAKHLTEARSHFSLWAMLNAPLMIGYDLRSADPALMEILGKREVIALNQDPAGNQAVLAYDSDDVSILVKALANGDKAIAVLNRTSDPVTASLTAGHLKFASDADVSLTHLWSGTHATLRDLAVPRYRQARSARWPLPLGNAGQREPRGRRSRRSRGRPARAPRHPALGGHAHLARAAALRRLGWRTGRQHSLFGADRHCREALRYRHRHPCQFPDRSAQQGLFPFQCAGRRR